MFQYAAGRVLALRHDAELKLDLSSFADYPLRRYELGAFPITAEILDKVDGAPQATSGRGWRGRIGRLTGALKSRPPTAMPVYREPHFHFDPSFASLKAPVHLMGYWQSPRYFGEIADVLRRDFTPRSPLDPINAAVAARIDNCDAVSLHVRRGDYVADPTTAKYHGICSIDYYERAIACVRDRIAGLQLFIFSDDPVWVRDNLMFDVPATFVAANSADHGYRDMQLMAQCKHHIVANSSFSWWGAWLNPSPEKIVIAPKDWFAAPGIDTRDLVPEAWIRL